jgi:manganese/iron transport system substrate-binding protein
MDPNNVKVWVSNIEQALSKADPAHASTYQANAEKYRQSLVELDQWAQQQVGQLPQPNRLLATDHQDFGYFANRYGFKQIGAIIPSFSTLSEPSAQELAALEDAIRALGARAIFVDKSVNPSLAQRVADDTHTQLIMVYSGSLSEAGGPAATYLDFMRYNVRAIVNALK